ncbi:hypothetical protein PR048_015668 [Dryococelus australis]|uniref:Uncharacterized protein n=1 Tax=Dryococelus australis TaxID=614101 RepID=A0ABQ9HHK0_9NEOP|nr:hypothetical protein PR048_015668 [Dryococelus australis]
MDKLKLTPMPYLGFEPKTSRTADRRRTNQREEDRASMTGGSTKLPKRPTLTRSASVHLVSHVKDHGAMVIDFGVKDWVSWVKGLRSRSSKSNMADEVGIGRPGEGRSCWKISRSTCHRTPRYLQLKKIEVCERQGGCIAELRIRAVDLSIHPYIGCLSTTSTYSYVLTLATIDLEAGVETIPNVVKGTGDDMLRDAQAFSASVLVIHHKSLHSDSRTMKVRAKRAESSQVQENTHNYVEKEVASVDGRSVDTANEHAEFGAFSNFYPDLLEHQVTYDCSPELCPTSIPVNVGRKTKMVLLPARNHSPPPPQPVSLCGSPPLEQDAAARRSPRESEDNSFSDSSASVKLSFTILRYNQLDTVFDVRLTYAQIRNDKRCRVPLLELTMLLPWPSLLNVTIACKYLKSFVCRGSKSLHVLYLSDVGEIYNETNKPYFTNQLEEFSVRGSGWALQLILHMDTHILQCRTFMVGAMHTMLPKFITNRRSCINVHCL